MKLLPVYPLRIERKSASGLAVSVVPFDAPPQSNRPFGQVWLPLSCVIIEKGLVVAVAEGIRKRKRLRNNLSER